MRNKAIIPDGDEFTDEGVRLNTAAITYFRPLLYLDEWSDKAAVSNRSLIEINRLYDGDVFAKVNIDNRSMPNLGLCPALPL